MALPQKVVEQLGREPPKTPGWSGQLLMFSGTVFIISLLIYAGIVFGYRPYLISQVESLNDQIQQFGQQIPAEEQKKIIEFYSQLVNLRGILADHLISSRAFLWFEDSTQANVYYKSFELDAARETAKIGGVAPTMEDINQQFAIFDVREELSAVDIGGVSQGKGEWSFNAELDFRAGYFKQGGASQ